MIEQAAMTPNATAEVTFDPLAYLHEYYGRIGPENRALLQFYAEVYSMIPSTGLLLEFGGGPVIYPLIAAAPYVAEIHFAEHLAANRQAVQRWLAQQPGAWDWSAFIRCTLGLERALNGACSPVHREDVARRAALVRSKVTRVVPCDAYQPHPLGHDARGRYGIVSMNFVAESICANESDWGQIMERLASLVAAGGTLLVTALLGAGFYAIGNRHIAAVDLSADQLTSTLSDLGFQHLHFHTIPAEHLHGNGVDGCSGYQGYTGIALYAGTRLTPAHNAGARAGAGQGSWPANGEPGCSCSSLQSKVQHLLQRHGAPLRPGTGQISLGELGAQPG